MRTTIEISDALREKLLAVAARRRMKGFSALVEEAVEAFLRTEAERDAKVKVALRLAGSIDRETAAHMRRVARRLRKSWR